MKAPAAVPAVSPPPSSLSPPPTLSDAAMAAPASQNAPAPFMLAALVERADVHKSCKAVEGLLGMFNEYCEAVGAVGALQKRLAKALREAAGVKGTGEIAGALFPRCAVLCAADGLSGCAQ